MFYFCFLNLWIQRWSVFLKYKGGALCNPKSYRWWPLHVSSSGLVLSNYEFDLLYIFFLTYESQMKVYVKCINSAKVKKLQLIYERREGLIYAVNLEWAVDVCIDYSQLSSCAFVIVWRWWMNCFEKRVDTCQFSPITEWSVLLETTAMACFKTTVDFNCLMEALSI